MTTLHIYLAQDRLRALARGESLPSRTNGAALFADISGFTALTEALRNALGPRRGAEELTRRIEAVYSALIVQIELLGGSVIEFAGDSMLCWFDDDLSLVAAIESPDAIIQAPGAQRAVACGVVLQRAMRAFARIVLPDKSTTALTLKVAVASGTAHRFVVGDPKVRWIDILAGAIVARTATAEHLAQAGEVLLDEFTANILDDSISIQEWREDPGSNDRFAVISRLNQPIDPPVLMQLDAGYIVPEELHPWVHAPLVEREQSGQVGFLIEFRPCVAMFVRFTGIDFDQDLAGPQLDAFVCQAQEIVARHGGTFLQLTIGDKGSYAYINFGVLSAHEDDARRAVSAALALQESIRQMDFLQPLQIGVTQGILRVGAYGGHSRKTFGALGDEVNLAARLMTTASAGEILLSGHVHKAVEPYFVFEPRSPVAMKGKVEPVPVFAVTGERKLRAIRLQEPDYALPMVGRANELKIVEEKLDLVLAGKSQVIGIIAEAGMGKSRLVAEAIRLARRKGFGGYGGACLSDSVNTPYLSWKSIWSAFFDIDPAASLKKQMRTLENALEDYAPDRLSAIPLLNSVLDMDIPENDFTSSLQPQYRKSALTALFEDCLRAASKDEPILIVVEDVHWIDALSHDLLEDLAKALVDCPICFVLAYRPPQLMRLQASRLEVLPQFTKIELHELSRFEAEQAIRAKLAQLYPSRAGAIPAQLVDRLMGRAQGNPFYLEELLNYLRDRGLDPRDPADLQKIELPDSLHALVLSRVDQLSEREKTTLRVASVVGRLFRAGWLTGYYPALGDLAHVKVDLDKLERMDITPLDSETELAYLFKHIVTHEVTYESLPFGLRAQLHEQLARYLEKQLASGSLPEKAVLDTLAFHYTRSNNTAKQREYLRKAGEAAQKSFANDVTLEYYSRLLPLLTDTKEKIEVHLKRGQVLELMGKWDEAEIDYRAALEMSKDDAALKASTQFALGKLSRLCGEYELALEWLAQAKEVLTALGDNAGLAQVLIETGFVLCLKGKIAQGREPLNEGLRLAREAGDKLGAALALTYLGDLAAEQRDLATGQALLEQSLNLQREMGDKWGIADSLNALGSLAHRQGDFATAQALFEESLNLRREMGDKSGIAGSLYDLGRVAHRRGDHATARVLFEESLSMAREMGDRHGIASSLNNLGNVALSQGDYAAGQALYEESLSLSRHVGNKWDIVYALTNLGNAAYVQGEYIKARVLYEEDLALCTEMDEKQARAYALLGLGLVDLAENKPEAREHIIYSLRLRQETGEQLYQTSSLVGVAGLALHEGDATFAAQLLGAVESAIKMLNGVMEEELIPFHTQTLAAVREQLGESAFQSAWEGGAKWSLEQAVKKAFGV
jgi:class 3 adenylate cyclase/tetratricopeptide (TPR) repeat protein